jgi:hypothetical protein
MCNMKRKDFYDVITGDIVEANNYGRDTATFKKVDNVDMVFDSRGSYLGIRTSKGKFVGKKYIASKGPYDFKSFLDLKIWAGQECSRTRFIETKDGMIMQIDKKKI